MDSTFAALDHIMTINHVFLRVTASRFAAVRRFYVEALKPLGYKELITVDADSYVGIGSDYPYLFLRALPEGQTNLPTHIAFDASSMCYRGAWMRMLTWGPAQELVDAFYQAGL